MGIIFSLISCTSNESNSSPNSLKPDISGTNQKNKENYLIEIKNGVKTFKNKEKKHIVMQGPVDTNDNRNGVWYSYFENGTINSMTTYNSKGENHGESWVNYPSGSIMYKGNWHNGKKNGKWVFYAKNGELKKTKEFKSK